jgi:hypothetical protein
VKPTDCWDSDEENVCVKDGIEVEIIPCQDITEDEG